MRWAFAPATNLVPHTPRFHVYLTDDSSRRETDLHRYRRAYCIEFYLLESAMTARRCEISAGLHLYGQSANMDAILKKKRQSIFLAAKNTGCGVVEDCAQAFGAQVFAECVARSPATGLIVIFSIKKTYPSWATEARITTNDPLCWKPRMLRDHGRSSRIRARFRVRFTFSGSMNCSRRLAGSNGAKATVE